MTAVGSMCEIFFVVWFTLYTVNFVLDEENGFTRKPKTNGSDDKGGELYEFGKWYNETEGNIPILRAIVRWSIFISGCCIIICRLLAIFK